MVNADSISVEMLEQVSQISDSLNSLKWDMGSITIAFWLFLFFKDCTSNGAINRLTTAIKGRLR